MQRATCRTIPGFEYDHWIGVSWLDSVDPWLQVRAQKFVEKTMHAQGLLKKLSRVILLRNLPREPSVSFSVKSNEASSCVSSLATSLPSCIREQVGIINWG